MKIPKHIFILGRKFKIQQHENLTYKGDRILGLCDYDNLTIYLEKKQSAKSKRQTLIHECCHGLLCISGIDQRLSESENEMYSQIFTAFVEDMKVIK